MSDWGLTAKYLAGECSAQECVEFEAWRKLSPENQAFYEAQKLLWQQSQEAYEGLDIDTEAGLKVLHDSIKQENQKQERESIWLKYAAALVFLLVSSVVWFVLQSPSEIVIVNETNEPMVLSLPDDSEVWLNRNAKLMYNREMTGEFREVRLEGEAYFDIMRMPERPFLVHTEKTTVRVLGTEFNIKADDLDKVVVSVQEGSVSFYQIKNTKEKIILKTAQTGVFNTAQESLEYRGKPNPNDLAWKTGVLRFDGEKLSIVAQYLREYYNTELTLKNGLADCSISTVFDKLPLSEALEIIELTLGLQVEESEAGITLSGSCTQ